MGPYALTQFQKHELAKSIDTFLDMMLINLQH